MWCEPRKNGVVYRERYKDPLTEKNKVVTVFKSKDTAQNRNKAQRELNAKIEAAIAELQCDDCSITLSQMQKRIPESSIGYFQAIDREKESDYYFICY